ncbi:MAG TPA: hypothetical protein VMC80_02355 [Patescibacteria group bacterium]|nr:hypothetical protein [Patescibacteria group bacterium]
MSAAKRGMLIFLAVIFFFAVMSAGIIFTISSSLEYNNVKTELTPVINNLLGTTLGLGNTLDSFYVLMNTYCQTNSQYVFNYANYSITFPCSVISQGKDAVLNYGAGELIKNFYYQSYDCKFFDCFNKGGLPLFLISDHTRIYLMNKFYILLAVIFVLLILMFLSTEKKANLLILTGALTIVASLPLLKLNTFSFLFPKQLNQIIDIFFSTSPGVFAKMIIAGGVLLILGIVFRIFGIAEKISERFSKERKEESKKSKTPKGK